MEYLAAFGYFMMGVAFCALLAPTPPPDPYDDMLWWLSSAAAVKTTANAAPSSSSGSVFRRIPKDAGWYVFLAIIATAGLYGLYLLYTRFWHDDQAEKLNKYKKALDGAKAVLESMRDETVIPEAARSRAEVELDNLRNEIAAKLVKKIAAPRLQLVKA